LGDKVVAAHHIPCGTCHFCLHGNHSMCSQFRKTNIEPGGFSQFIKLSGLHVKNTVFRIPDGFDLLKALFTEPLACCIRAMDRIKKLPGDILSVVGTGAIGMLFIQLAKLDEMKVVAIDLDENRLELARDMGADYTINPEADEVTAGIKKITTTGIDAAVLTVTNKYTLSDALSYIRPGGSINIFGVAEKESVIPVDLQKIYKNELTLKSTYSSTPETLSRAFHIITGGKIDVTPLISKPLPLSDFKKGLDLMLEKKIYKAFYNLQ
jgi:L-iditol 2-dehydrogenase